MVASDAPKLMSQMRRGTLEYCVMAALRDRDCYGLELTRFLASSGELGASEGTIYPLLSRLRRDDLVETFWRESGQGPPRRYYKLTGRGRESLKLFIEHWERFRSAVDQILADGTE
jgi:PadR family transcriptional regulator, regulatory protein PadR